MSAAQASGVRRSNTWGAALWYAKNLGFPVFPVHYPKLGRDGRLWCSCGKADCANKAKHPLTPNGLKDATTDPAQIDSFWKRDPRANVAVAIPPDIVGLDIDPRHGGDASLAELEAVRGPFPETARVLTGGGGSHIYGRVPPSVQISNNNTGKLGTGIDIKAFGGYLLLPPSLHISNRVYEWELTLRINDVGIADWPQWLINAISQPTNSQNSGQRFELPDKIRDGTRNEYLFRYARSLHARKSDFDEILDALRPVNQRRCEPPLEDGELFKIARNAATLRDTSSFTNQGDQSNQVAPNPPFTLVKAGTESVKAHHWLSPERLLRGNINNVQGDPGDGKSLLTGEFAAKVSKGIDFATGAVCDPGNVIMLAGEDGLRDTILARLKAADADLSRIFVWAVDHKENEAPPTFPRDIERLGTLIKEHRAVLVTIDPFEAFLDDKMDPNSNPSIRKALAALAWLAATYDVCILLVRHLSKDPKIKNAKYRGGGSIAITGAARCNWHAGPNPNDPESKVFAPVKNNYTKPLKALGYRIVDTIVDAEKEIHAPKIEWLGEVEITADQMLGGGTSTDKKRGPEPSKLDAAEKFLLAELADGVLHDSNELKKKANQQLGISGATLWAAKERLVEQKKVPIKPRKKGYGGSWGWYLDINVMREAEETRLAEADAAD
jgi:Bifunctional DNA primase/polymerase, N-terminal/AAA domain/Primase C terminal 1 (PriCT-1)